MIPSYRCTGSRPGNPNRRCRNRTSRYPPVRYDHIGVLAGDLCDDCWTRHLGHEERHPAVALSPFVPPWVLGRLADISSSREVMKVLAQRVDDLPSTHQSRFRVSPDVTLRQLAGLSVPPSLTVKPELHGPLPGRRLRRVIIAIVVVAGALSIGGGFVIQRLVSDHIETITPTSDRDDTSAATGRPTTSSITVTGPCTLRMTSDGTGRFVAVGPDGSRRPPTDQLELVDVDGTWMAEHAIGVVVEFDIVSCP